MVLVVRSVVAWAVPPPSGMVIVRLVWLEAMVRVGVAEAVWRLKAKAVVARERKMIAPRLRKLSLVCLVCLARKRQVKMLVVMRAMAMRAMVSSEIPVDARLPFWLPTRMFRVWVMVWDYTWVFSLVDAKYLIMDYGFLITNY